MQGKVKWFGSKGYGFITCEDGVEVFVHHSAIQMQGYRILNPGDVVEFEIEETDSRGPKAVNVTRTEAAVPGLVTEK